MQQTRKIVKIQALHNYDRVSAIKAYRAATDEGLKDSKDVIDDCIRKCTSVREVGFLSTGYQENLDGVIAIFKRDMGAAGFDVSIVKESNKNDLLKNTIIDHLEEMIHDYIQTGEFSSAEKTLELIKEVKAL